MTIRKPSKNLLLALLAAAGLLFPVASAAQRAKTFYEALEMAGDDGVIAYCYGPDWNRRSVRMLKTFWENPATEAAAGNAVMVAVPHYQSNESEGAAEAGSIRGNLPHPPAGICPTVYMVDKSGSVYATLTGADDLGDETGTLGAENIKAKLAELRLQRELLAKAAQASGVEKAKLLSQVTDLSIKAPKGIVDEIQLADPQDSTGAVRRNKHNAFYGFMYKQLETADGFLKKDFVPDVRAIGEACREIYEDEAYRNEDRQAAYVLIIGLSRAAGVPSNQLKGMINKCQRIDPTTVYGKLCPSLIEKWTGKGANADGGSKKRKTAAVSKAEREARVKAAKERRERKKAERKARRSGKDEADEADEEEEED